MEDNLHKELAELSPLLNDLRKKKEGFKVPDGYFEQLQVNVLTQLQEEKPPIVVSNPISVNAKHPSLWEQFLMQLEWLIRPRYAVAFGSVALLIAASWYLFKSNDTINDNCTTLACVSDTEIEQYIEENIEDFETEQLWQSSEDAIAEVTAKTSKTEQEKNTQNPTKKYHLKEANDEELDEMLDEMIQNGELSEEELEDIL